MAYVDGRWLDRSERKARIVLITERARKLKALVESGKATDFHVDTLRKDLAELKRLKRIHRAEIDMTYFFYEYFSDVRNPGNPDNLVPGTIDIEDAPDFHRKLSRILDSVSNVNKTARIAWAASRGHAKSAYLSNAYPLREIAYRKRRMILIISETNAGSKKFIKWCAGQLKYNLKFVEDFGVLLHEQKSRNEKDSEEAFLTTTGIKMEATSLGTQIRGFRNGAYRPDLILLDDLESRDSNNTAELRTKAKNWLNQDLMPAYDPTRTAVIFMGTIVHPDSLLNYVLNERRDFIKNRFPAILSHPERPDLWDEFERIYREYEPTQEEIDAMECMDGDMEAQETPNANAALRFYHENKADMDRGVEVLWPNRFPIERLMLEKVNLGSLAFSSEFLNNPIDEESQIFKPEQFTYYDYGEVDPRELEFFAAWDIAFGAKARNDYNAILTIGRHRKSGVLYVWDVWMTKCKANEALDIAVEKIDDIRHTKFAVETIQAQVDLYRQLEDAVRRRHLYQTRLVPITTKRKKEERIESLQPLCENGTIRFRRDQRLLLEMFEQYPSHRHDDGPDALAYAVDLATVKGRTRRTYSQKPAGF